MPTRIHLPGVPHTFTDYHGLVGFLHSSPGYVGRQRGFLESYWPGALHDAGYQAPAPPKVAAPKPVAIVKPAVKAPAPVRAPVQRQAGEITSTSPTRVAGVNQYVARPAPGLVARGNVDIAHRLSVPTPGMPGYRSTVRSITVTDNQGRAYVLPTVVNGRVVSNEEAVKHWQRTGQHLGVFKTEAQANAYSESLHREQARLHTVPIGRNDYELQRYGFVGASERSNRRQAAELQRSTAYTQHRLARAQQAQHALIAPKPQPTPLHVGFSLTGAARGVEKTAVGIGETIAHPVRAGLVRAPHQIVHDPLGRNEGKIVAYDPAGNPIRQQGTTGFPWPTPIRALGAGVARAITRTAIERPADIVSQARVAEHVPALPVSPSAARGTAAPAPLLYHGSPHAFSGFRLAKADPKALYGPGVYLTDSPEVASGYARANPKTNEIFPTLQAAEARGQELRDAGVFWHTIVPEGSKWRVAHSADQAPNVQIVRANVRKPFDVRAALDPAEARHLIQRAGVPSGDVENMLALAEHLGGRANPPLTGQWLYDHLANQLGKAGANRALRKAGYDAITHTGGLITGGAEHNVTVVLDPRIIERGLGPPRPTGSGAPIAKTPELAPTPEQKVYEALGPARRVAGEQRKLRSEELSRRVGKMSPAYESAGGGTAGVRAAKRQLAGKLPALQFNRLTDLTDEHVGHLLDVIHHHPDLRPLEKISLQDAIIRSSQGQALPPYAIKLAERAFGPEAAAQLSRSRQVTHAVMRGAAEVANLPRSILATLDVSAAFRQALMAGAANPRIWAKNFGPMFKYFASEKRYAQTMNEITTRPGYKDMVESGVKFTDLGDLSTREEQFMSNLAEKLTGGKYGPVRASSRAYVGFLNRMRADMFDHMLADAAKHGHTETPKLRRDTARFVNFATGRGELGRLEPAAVALNSLLFSPRLLASRLNAVNPAFYASLHPYVRRQALLASTKLLAAGSAGATAAALAGATVNTDPTNADFGKIRVGDTRVDIWGGHQQLVRLAAQIAAGKVTSSTTGKTLRLTGGHSLSRQDILKRFAEAKLAPVPSAVNDFLKGEDFAGKPFSVKNAVTSRVIPLGVQDARDLYHLTGSPGKAAASLGLSSVGVGVQTYAAKPAAPARLTPLELVKKLGLGSSLPAPVAKSLARSAERDAAWTSATKGKQKGTRDWYVARYKADVQLAQKWGYLTAAEAAKENEWVAHAPIDDVRTAHHDLSKPGGMYDRELSSGRESYTWLKAQQQYADALDKAVKAKVLTPAEAVRERKWARGTDAASIDENRTALERELLAPAPAG